MNNLNSKFSRFSYLPNINSNWERNIQTDSNLINLLDKKIYQNNILHKFSQIKKVEREIIKDKNENKEYVSIHGCERFNQRALKFIFEFDKNILDNTSYFSNLTFSREGAITIILNFIKKFYPSFIYIPKLKSNIYRERINYFELYLKEYDFFKLKNNKEIDLENLKNEINKVNYNSFIILPLTETDFTGITLNNEQWEEISKIIHERKIIPIFDIPNQGLFSNDIKQDTNPLKYFLKKDLIILQNLDYNFGIYSERVGAIHIFSEKENIQYIQSQLNLIVRTIYCNPHKFGPLMVTRILENEDYKNEHIKELSNIMEIVNENKNKMIENLKYELFDKDNHKGIYLDLKISKNDQEKLRKNHSISTDENGIINLTLLNDKIIKDLCEFLNNVGN